MADFLTINAVVYDVLEGGAEQGDPEIVGESKRAIDATLRSGVQTMKRAYRFTLKPMSQASYNSLEALVYSGAFQACAGDAIAADDYEVRITRAGYLVDELSFLRGVEVALRQV